MTQQLQHQLILCIRTATEYFAARTQGISFSIRILTAYDLFPLKTERVVRQTASTIFVSGAEK